MAAYSAAPHGNIAQPPLSVIAAWPKADYENGVRRSWLPAYAITLVSFTTMLVIMRLMLRARRQGGGLGLDDALLVPGWLILVGMTAVAVYASRHGFVDRHLYDMPLENYWQDALNAFIGQFMFVIGTCCTRVSILLFYRRLTKGTFEKKWEWAVWVAISFTIAYSLVMAVLLFFACSPPEAYWLGFKPGYDNNWTCADGRWSNYVAGSLAIFSDAYSILLPAVMLWPLNMPPRQKLGLMAIFATSSLTLIAAGMRTRSLIYLGIKYDASWNGFEIYVWSLAEYNLGIMCACAPSLRALFSVYFNWTSRYSSDGSGSSSSRSDNNNSRPVKIPAIPLVARHRGHTDRSSSAQSDTPIVMAEENGRTTLEEEIVYETNQVKHPDKEIKRSLHRLSLH